MYEFSHRDLALSLQKKETECLVAFGGMKKEPSNQVKYESEILLT